MITHTAEEHEGSAAKAELARGLEAKQQAVPMPSRTRLLRAKSFSPAAERKHSHAKLSRLGSQSWVGTVNRN